MGYYTKHKIRIINEYNTKKNLKILLNRQIAMTSYSFIITGSTIHDIHSGLNDGIGCKWYSCARDMELISRVFPELKIQIKGLGEDGEMWERIYHNGCIQKYYCDEFSDIDDEADFKKETENNQLFSEDEEEEEEEEENEEEDEKEKKET